MRGKHHLTIAWFGIAFLCVAASIWQIQWSLAKEQAEKNKQLPPPVKTRHFLRDEIPGKSLPDYASRKQQGLTDREIGWIIEDFQYAGLDQGIRSSTTEDCLKQRKQQDRWYRDLMAEAWAATPEQSLRMTEKLGEIFDQARVKFLKDIDENSSTFEKDGKQYRIVSSSPIHRLIDARSRFQEAPETYQWWNLCDLPDPATAEPGNREIRLDDTPFDEFQWLDSFFPPGSTPSAAAPPDKLLVFIRTLHPAQLKLYLLTDPGLVGTLQKTLEAEAAGSESKSE